MMTRKWKIALSCLVLLLMDISMTTGESCKEARPTITPANSTLFSIEYWDGGTLAEMRHICDFITGANGKQGEDFIINRCELGIWEYGNRNMPNCEETKSFCFSQYSFTYGNNCYRWIPSLYHDTSKFLCSKYSGSSLAVIEDEAELKAITEFFKENPLGFSKYQSLNNKSFFWLGLSRLQSGEMSWATKPRTNDWKNWWKEGHPRATTSKVGILFPEMKLFTPSAEDQKYYIGLLRMFALCKIAANKAIHPAFTRAERLYIVESGKSLDLEIPGGIYERRYTIIYSRVPWLMNKHKNNYTYMYQSGDFEVQRLFRDAESKNERSKKSQVVVSLMRSVSSDQTIKGMQCNRSIEDGPLRRVNVHLNQHNFVDGDMNVDKPERYCRLKDTNNVILPVSRTASSGLTGTWLASDWTTGMEQYLYAYVIESDGWSIWTQWSTCTREQINKNVHSIRTRVCGAAFARHEFTNEAACEGRRTDIHRKLCVNSTPSSYEPPKMTSTHEAYNTPDKEEEVHNGIGPQEERKWTT